MSVRHALLALLSEGPKYGLQLRDEFEQRTGEVWPLNVGQVYTTLQRLERDGLVESDGDGEAGAQKSFRITKDGAAELSSWLRTPPDLSSPPRDELVIKVLVAIHVSGVDVHDVIQTHRRHVVELMQADLFVTAGWSGGGPHALACAAILPERCLSAATVAGVAPYMAPGLDWLAGQGEENVEEFDAALRGEKDLTDWLTEAAVSGDYAEWWAASLRKAVSTGIAGWRDDDLAILAPWGFDLGDIMRPVSIWQGGQDRMVPFAHGEWLASHVPTARAHLLPEDGHLSITVGRIGQIIEDLVELAGFA
jgi:DNA-binding PadR family transcriptional regulator